MLKRRSIYFLSLASLVTLAGCWGKKDDKSITPSTNIKPGDTSLVLLTINGQPKITVNSLDADVNELAEFDQQTKMLLMFDPEGAKERIFREQKRLAVIEEWGIKNGIANLPDYQAKLARILNHVYKQLFFEQFLEQHKVNVTDADVQLYYDQNKDQDYRILIAPAGIKSQSVEFATKAAADAFVVKLKQAGVTELEKVAKEQDPKLLVRNLGNINENSYADKEIKEAVLKQQKFPAVLVVQNKEKNKFVVVVAYGQEAAKYHDFDAIKDQLKQMLLPRKIGEMLEIKIPEYALQLNVVENNSYFDDLKKAKAIARNGADDQKSNDVDELIDLDKAE